MVSYKDNAEAVVKKVEKVIVNLMSNDFGWVTAQVIDVAAKKKT